MRELRPVTRRAITTGAGAALGLVLVAAWLVWWVPAIVLVLGRLACARVRFGLVMGWGDLLRGLGRVEAARRLYTAEAARCERRRAVEGRRG